MGGPGTQPLNVKESDNSVQVRPCTILSFNAGDFTVAGSGRTATISIDSTGTGATLTATYVGYGNASNLMTGADKLVFDDSGTGFLGVGGVTPDSPIHLKGSGGYMKLNSTGSASTIKSDFNLDLYGDFEGTNSAAYQNIRFYTAGTTEKARIDTNGGLRIGTTSEIGASGAAELLTLSRNGANVEFAMERIGGSAFRIQNQSSLTTFGTTDSTTLAFISNGSQRGVLTSGGIFGFGTTSPDSGVKVDIDGGLIYLTHVETTNSDTTIPADILKNGLIQVTDNSNHNYKLPAGTVGARCTIGHFGTGDLVIDATTNSQTLNGGLANKTLSTARMMYELYCYASNEWVLLSMNAV